MGMKQLTINNEHSTQQRSSLKTALLNNNTKEYMLTKNEQTLLDEISDYFDFTSAAKCLKVLSTEWDDLSCEPELRKFAREFIIKEIHNSVGSIDSCSSTRNFCVVIHRNETFDSRFAVSTSEAGEILTIILRFVPCEWEATNDILREF
jgi:hypothetical protein